MAAPPAPPRDFSRLAGDLNHPPLHRKKGEYRVRYRSVTRSATRAKWRLCVSILLGLFNVMWYLAYVSFLAVNVKQPTKVMPPATAIANDIVIVSIFLMATLSLINVVSFSIASIVARDPIPVTPEPGHRVAFVTAIVPSKESIATVMETLKAALKIKYDVGETGVYDVWLLDEGRDDEIRRLCADNCIHYFSRKDLPRYNTKKGQFRAKTKHGNYNAWVDRFGDRYDFLASVDNDHLPVPVYLERMLGYLRDPNVAFVVGPQAYGNIESIVSRAAESQQFPFHSIIQRAANFWRIPMLVGTNYVMRIDALRGVGGFADSITEDMATGLKLHTSRNPLTGKRWKSVYTPDVVSLGEGPTTWGAYFGQQDRWSRGTFEVLKHDMPRRGWRLTPPRMLHYALITTFYPSMALGWILGAVNAVLYLAFGANGISVPVEIWIALYVDTTLFQLWVYARNRRYNVSPVEAEGTFGLMGMILSVLTSPIYAGAFIRSITGRKSNFAVTPKGDMAGSESLTAFKYHFAWLFVFAGATATALWRGYFTLAVYMWPALAVVTCLAPFTIYCGTLYSARRAKAAAARSTAVQLSALTTSPEELSA